MNKKTTTERAKIIQLLVEGNSLRSTARITGYSINTVLKLLPEAGEACQKYHDAHVRGLSLARVQVDEMHSFINKRRDREGEAWVWIGMCADTKLVTNWHVGDRDIGAAKKFINDLAWRLKDKIHLISDGLGAYREAVDEAFGEDVDFSMLVKQYDELTHRRYKGAKRENKVGNGPKNEVSTSFIERQNLTVRMGCRRFTRRTNAFSKKLENHRHALALHFMYYNFCRIHGTLRVTPAMEVGLSQHVWSIEELVDLIGKDWPAPPKPIPEKPIKSLPASHFRWDGRGRRNI